MTTRSAAPVVVATDGSPESRRALYWGLHEAADRLASAVLVHVYPFPFYGAPYGVAPPPPVDLELEPAAKAVLDAELEEAQRFGRDVEVTGRLECGPVVPTLLEAAKDAQLLVVGSRGLGGPRGTLGSVSLHLAAHARCPVAVVRRRDGDPPPPGRVVVGVDGSPEARQAARLAAETAHRRGAPLQMVHAWHPPTLSWPDPLTGRKGGPAGAEEAERRDLEGLADAIGAEWPDLPVEVRFVHEHPVTAVVEASRHADLVVVGCRGRGAFAGMLLGSVSQAVVREAASPVLVVHPR